jgi:acyl-homoserine lactone synthase
MLRIIHEGDDPALMERVWAFRHARFVEEMGWSALRRPDQRERDEFDTEQTRHAVLMLREDVVGYSRLLPTCGPHLVQKFCARASISAPSGPRIYEWSRCATAPNASRVCGLPAADILMTGVLEGLVQLGASAILFLTYPSLVAMMRRRGYPVQVLATLTTDNGDQVHVVFSELPADLLERHRNIHGIKGSIVSWGADVLQRQEPCLTTV